MINREKQRTAADFWARRRGVDYYTDCSGRNRAIHAFIVMAAISGLTAVAPRPPAMGGDRAGPSGESALGSEADQL